MTVTEPAPLPTRRENPFDPPLELRLLRADRPVSRPDFPGGGEAWLVTRADEVRRVQGSAQCTRRKSSIRMSGTAR